MVDVVTAAPRGMLYAHCCVLSYIDCLSDSCIDVRLGVCLQSEALLQVALLITNAKSICAHKLPHFIGVIADAHAPEVRFA